MRTFHTGGVAGDDITQGLPRVVELFEARTPKGVAPISEAAGRVRIEETEKTKKIVVTPDDGSDETAYPISKRARLLVGEGDHVEVGQKLTVGAINPHDVLRILGQRAVQVHLVGEVQKVYRSQGVSIHDKHIEIIIRQMLRRVTIIESGDAELLPGELVERSQFETENRRVVAEGGHPASGRPQLMGITKASLATESWLSAASFQETTRVLTDAAIHAKSDSLLGLKENVIIGKLIPAGTGLPRYRNIRVEPTEEAKAAMYSAVGYDDIDYSPVRLRLRPGRSAGGLRLRSVQPVSRSRQSRHRAPATLRAARRVGEVGEPGRRVGALVIRTEVDEREVRCSACDLCVCTGARCGVRSCLRAWGALGSARVLTDGEPKMATPTILRSPTFAGEPAVFDTPDRVGRRQPQVSFTEIGTQKPEKRCPRSSSWSARAGRTRSRRPRRPPSRVARSAVASARASTRPPRRSRTRRCARSRVSA